MSYRICTSCGASDGQGCYSECPIMLQARVAELEAALVRVMIGSNSLAQIIGADHPPYGTSYDEALAHYGGGVKYEAWCCWNSIMQARAVLDPTQEK